MNQFTPKRTIKRIEHADENGELRARKKESDRSLSEVLDNV